MACFSKCATACWAPSPPPSFNPHPVQFSVDERGQLVDLGVGTFAVVYLARLDPGQQRVAVKVRTASSTAAQHSRHDRQTAARVAAKVRGIEQCASQCATHSVSTGAAATALTAAAAYCAGVPSLRAAFCPCPVAGVGVGGRSRRWHGVAGGGSHAAVLPPPRCSLAGRCDSGGRLVGWEGERSGAGRAGGALGLWLRAAASVDLPSACTLPTCRALS